MENRKYALWIDEEEMALSTYVTFIQDCFGDEIIVLPEPPLLELSSMLDRVIAETDLVALILDQRLKSTGMANYTGIELAEAVRRLNKKLPIYILTNHVDDIGDLDYQVEYVLEKDYLHEAPYRRTVAARVRRHADIYTDIISDREIRFDELLCKSLQVELTADEKEEFEKLDFWRNKAMFAREESFADGLKNELDKQQIELEALRTEIERQCGEEK